MGPVFEHLVPRWGRAMWDLTGESGSLEVVLKDPYPTLYSVLSLLPHFRHNMSHLTLPPPCLPPTLGQTVAPALDICSDLPLLL